MKKYDKEILHLSDYLEKASVFWLTKSVFTQREKV